MVKSKKVESAADGSSDHPQTVNTVSFPEISADEVEAIKARVGKITLGHTSVHSSVRVNPTCLHCGSIIHDTENCETWKIQQSLVMPVAGSQTAAFMESDTAIMQKLQRLLSEAPSIPNFDDQKERTSFAAEYERWQNKVKTAFS